MLKKSLAAALALAAYMMLAACVSERPDVELGTAPPLVIEEVEHGDRPATMIVDRDSDAPVEIESSACACETADCVHNWIQEEVGCGVCVDMVCADGRRIGGCLPCDGELQRLYPELSPAQNVRATVE